MDTERLLELHKPVLKYDSQESYFADSAAVWTDNPGNRLERKDGTVIAVAGKGLALALLGARYANGERALDTDRIADPSRKYREQARHLHEQAQYANRAYGHSVLDGDGRLWLQYWFFYFYNDYNLIGRILRAGLHEGDWEMVQIRLDENRVPDRAVYTQHSNAEARDWREVDVVPGTQRPIVYVARGSHACYFEPGTHWTGHWFDHADAKRRSPELLLEIVDENDPKWRWLRWPGRWGDTVAGDSPLDSNSPRSPGVRSHWDDPRKLEGRIGPPPGPADGQPVAPPPPQVLAEWEDGRLELHFNVGPGPAQPVALTVTVNSRDEGSPPTTESFPVRARSGSVTLAALMQPTHHYGIYVSSATREGLASESVRVELPPASTT